MTIKNFGLMWEREFVQWSGVRGRPGGLKGKGPIGNPTKDQRVVDFREQIGVYILYRNERVVYVGQAGKGGRNTLFSRLKNHLEDHLADRWDRFSWFGIRNVNATGELAKSGPELTRSLKADAILNLLEGLLINVVEPPLNKQGAKWSASDSRIDQYYQLHEGWSAWSDRELLIAIAEKLRVGTA